MGAAMNLEDYLKLVGTELGVSEWHTVDQKQIDAFADATEDFQFIHIDPERAKRETPFGGNDRARLSVAVGAAEARLCNHAYLERRRHVGQLWLRQDTVSHAGSAPANGCVRGSYCQRRL